ncbi:MAG TPA: SH3 domain-containing protein [Aggregatilinea sp.]|uniref:SH3 domain-containing protein n=1 Tax=Aggregatilinea sp. TaxID=2806333 RepID=UPI002BE1B4EE|nr:SH3 domain-containing protein [Aggregatilinea sp.]HML24956.1 SH3 domain-containing protein [Aggregatilinea sp.]
MKALRWMLPLAAAVLVLGGVFWASQGQLAFAQGGTEEPADDEGPGPVVFASDRLGNYDIFVLNPQTGQLDQLTDDPGMDIEPVWSPDGEYIAFSSDRDGDFEVYVIRADGTDVVKLTGNEAEDREPKWQPNGEWLTYVSNANGQWDVFVVSADGAEVRQLTNDVNDERIPGSGGTAEAGETPEAPAAEATATIAAPTPTVPVPDGTVNTPRLNMRSNPGEGASVLAQLSQSDPVDVVGRLADNSWLQIVASGTTGWVYAPYVTLTIDLGSVPVVNALYMPAPTATPVPPTAVPVTTIPPTSASATPVISFTVDRTTITSGECVNFSWSTANIQSVYFQGTGVVGVGTQQVCPTATTTYELRVILPNGSADPRYITITVS